MVRDVAAPAAQARPGGLTTGAFRPRGRDLLVCAVLVALVLGVYARTAGHEFVNYDVPDYVTENPHVREGFSREGLAWAFLGSHAANWHPLTWLSHMLDCELFGLDPRWHHLSSVALHGLNAALLFLALRALTRGLAPPGFWAAAFVAATFAVHPLRVESVAWVAERKDVLSGTFFCLTLLAWARYVRGPTAGRLALVSATFALGLMAKPMLVTLPFVLLLLDGWPCGRIGAVAPRRLFLEKAPLFALSAVSCVLTLVAQLGAGAARAAADLSLAARVLTALRALLFYLEKTVWPSGLAFFYPHPALASRGALGPLLAPALLGAAVLAALSVLAWRERRRRPWLAVGWLWFLGMLVPVIGLVQVGHQGWADRYAYLPLVGLGIAVAWTAEEVSAAWGMGRVALGVAAALAVVGLSAVTWRQVGTWSDSVALYRRAAAVAADNEIVHYNLGTTLARAGEYAEARRELERAVELHSGHYGAWYELGELYLRAGEVERAAEAYGNAVSIAPDHVPARRGVGLALAWLGHDARARVELEHALAADSEDAIVHHWLSILAWRRGDTTAAERHCRATLRLQPDFTEALANLAAILAATGDTEGARSAARRAVALDPGQAAALRDLGVLEAQ